MSPQVLQRDFLNGNITPEGMEVLQVVYPHMHQRLIERVVETVEQNPDMPYQIKLKLMRIAGIPQRGIGTVQMAFMPEEEEQGQAPRKKKSGKVKRGTEKDLIKRNTTAAQSTLA